MNIVDILSFHLDESKLKNDLLFRLGGFETLLLFREDLVQSITSAGISGMHFVPAEGYRV